MLKRALAVSILALTAAMPAHADAISDAMAEVQKYAGEKTTWDGPTTGPAAAAAKKVVGKKTAVAKKAVGKKTAVAKKAVARTAAPAKRAAKPVARKAPAKRARK
mgnify:CR=1 FL=1